MAGGFVVVPSGPATRHVALAVGPVPAGVRAVFCAAAGSITLQDEAGTALEYTLAAGQLIPLAAVAVTAMTGDWRGMI